MRSGLILSFLTVSLLAQQPQSSSEIPHGQVSHHTWTSTRIYPGTARDYWIYVPAQYRAEKPAAVMIFQDGGQFVRDNAPWHAPAVFDLLIQRGEMPVTIGIFIEPGIIPARNDREEARYNRSYEYDSVGDRYARFLLEEIVPEVRHRYNLSKDPSDWGLAGSSSGGICAFNAAWYRPDAFRRVLSFIGSYTDLRGGGLFASRVRKFEPRPLRVFLQDGTRDLNIYSGSWYIANQQLASALDFAGYESKFVVGSEGHNSIHGSAILPDALRWLWEGWPRVIGNTAAPSDRYYARELVEPGRRWELAPPSASSASEHRQAAQCEYSATTAQGATYCSDTRAKRVWRVDGKGARQMVYEGAAGPLALSPDQSQLNIAEHDGRWIWALQVRNDGSLGNAEPFFRLDVPEDISRAGTRGLAVDREGFLYAATELGIQVFDPPGHLLAILEAPAGVPVTGLTFGGPDLAWLYAHAGDKIWRRPMRRRGVLASEPVKPPKPRL